MPVILPFARGDRREPSTSGCCRWPRRPESISTKDDPMKITRLVWAVLLMLGLVARGAAHPSPAEGYVDVPGGRVWYRVLGSGPGIPLLVLHGGPGGRSGRLIALAALGDERPVVFYDQLGCGHSVAPDDPEALARRSLRGGVGGRTLGPGAPASAPVRTLVGQHARPGVPARATAGRRAIGHLCRSAGEHAPLGRRRRASEGHAAGGRSGGSRPARSGRHVTVHARGAVKGGVGGRDELRQRP